jgi:hypothetical protein
MTRLLCARETNIPKRVARGAVRWLGSPSVPGLLVPSPPRPARVRNRTSSAPPTRPCDAGGERTQLSQPARRLPRLARPRLR